MSRIETYPVDGLDVDVSWIDFDPTKWRERDDPEADGQLEDDEDEPASRGVKSMLGFDPDEEGWDDEDTPAERLKKSADVNWDEMYP